MKSIEEFSSLEAYEKYLIVYFTGQLLMGLAYQSTEKSANKSIIENAINMAIDTTSRLIVSGGDQVYGK